MSSKTKLIKTLRRFSKDFEENKQTIFDEVQQYSCNPHDALNICCPDKSYSPEDVKEVCGGINHANVKAIDEDNHPLNFHYYSIPEKDRRTIKNCLDYCWHRLRRHEKSGLKGIVTQADLKELREIFK